jgi:GTP-binding protein
VAGRGELQLAILIETMRREGFEMCVGRPRVVMQIDPDTGKQLEPVEEVTIDVDEEFASTVVKKLSERRAELADMRPSGSGRQRLIFHAPTRGLIGYHGELLSDTRGTAIMNRMFHAYTPHVGAIPARRTGVLIANSDGDAVAYALWNLEDRGPMFVTPGTKVYAGMIVGEHTRGNDLEVNVLKGKKLSNVRASGKDDAVTLTPPVKMTLEKALAFVSDEELVEVTPQSIRLRKALLDPHERKRAEKRKAEVA